MVKSSFASVMTKNKIRKFVWKMKPTKTRTRIITDYIIISNFRSVSSESTSIWYTIRVSMYHISMFCILIISFISDPLPKTYRYQYGIWFIEIDLHCKLQQRSLLKFCPVAIHCLILLYCSCVGYIIILGWKPNLLA